MRYFDSFQEFLSTVRRYQKYLSGCAHCGFIWLSMEVIVKHGISEEDMQEIQRCIFDLNDMDSRVHMLKKMKIEMSHGFCTPCYRFRQAERNRREQQAMGFTPCFGTANHGHCSQSGCKWRNACVTDQDTLLIWKEKIRCVDVENAVH